MSEVTTGTVSFAVIAPLAVGAACVGAVYYGIKYIGDQYDKMIENIEKTNQQLKWLNKQVCSSPVQIAQEAKRLQKMVSTNSHFLKMTQGLSAIQKNILAGAIATQHSPLKAYVTKDLEKFETHTNAFEEALKQGTRNLALDNFKFVNSVVSDAAKATGFGVQTKVLRKTDSLVDVVFTDSQNRKLSAYCKLDKQMNPSMALDLEGFRNNTNECSVKMSEIVKYLQDHEVPFTFKSIKHNQPHGVLRKLINQKKEHSAQGNVNNYLTNQLSSTKTNLKTR